MTTMHRRIVGRQQQVSLELGRLRMGTYEGNRPAASKTWILTSPFRRYLDHAAALRNEDGTPIYGGTVEEWQPQGKGAKEWRLITQTATIDALLAPGDPVNQANEMWSAGGVQRRCDGEQEQRSGEPCLCRAQFGEEFYRQKDGTVCKTHTRINVLIEDLLGVGFWRVETKGFYASGRVPGLIDMVKALVGPTVLIPIQLTIVPRTKVEDGKTSRYMELVAQIPGFTFGQFRRGELEGLTELDAYRPKAIGAATPAIEPPQTRAENRNKAPVSAGQTRSPAPAARVEQPARVPAAPATRVGGGAAASNETGPTVIGGDTGSLEKLIADATTDEQMRALWNQVAETKDNALKEAWRQRRTAIRNGVTAPAPVQAEPDPVTAVDGEVEPDREAMWATALRLAGRLGWDTATTSRRFREEIGRDPAAADGWAHDQFVTALTSGLVQ